MCECACREISNIIYIYIYTQYIIYMHNHKIISVYCGVCVFPFLSEADCGRTWRSLSTFNARAKAAVPNCPGARRVRKTTYMLPEKGLNNET